MSLNLNAALSSFIAASLRIIHHSKTQHWKKKKKKKKLPLTCLATKTLSVCEPSILIVLVVARAGLFRVRQIREWATYVLYLLFIFTLRYVIAPFRYLSRPLISAALAPALRLGIYMSMVFVMMTRLLIWFFKKTLRSLYCFPAQFLSYRKWDWFTCLNHLCDKNELTRFIRCEKSLSKEEIMMYASERERFVRLSSHLIFH